MPYNGYSEEYLDRLENGSIPADNKSYSKRKFLNLSLVIRTNSFPLGQFLHLSPRFSLVENKFQESKPAMVD